MKPLDLVLYHLARELLAASCLLCFDRTHFSAFTLKAPLPVAVFVISVAAKGFPGGQLELIGDQPRSLTTKIMK